jgi:hypothetical protein
MLPVFGGSESFREGRNVTWTVETRPKRKCPFVTSSCATSPRHKKNCNCEYYKPIGACSSVDRAPVSETKSRRFGAFLAQIPFVSFFAVQIIFVPFFNSKTPCPIRLFWCVLFCQLKLYYTGCRVCSCKVHITSLDFRTRQKAFKSLETTSKK